MNAPPGFRDSPERALGAGEVVASTFTIRDEIARTETGVVYEARDMMLDRILALKVAWRDAGTPSLILEARRCAAVHDRCAVEIHTMGMHEGVEYVVAERVTGTLLRDALSGPLPYDLYLPRLRTLVAAVAHAHDARIAIGEISGSTVLVCADAPTGSGATDAPKGGRLVLGRLSLSQVPAFGPHGRTLVPEVVRGEVGSHDPAGAQAIDLYGLGCVAVEMACGSPPFADDDAEIESHGHALERPPRIADLRPDLPNELSDLVDWLLAKQPVMRPRSVTDVLAQVDSVIARLGNSTHAVRVLIVDDDTARARWLWSLARRAHPSAIVEIATEGTDAAHKLNRDQPDLVFVDATLRGVMNALELCMYARGLEGGARGQIFLIGAVSDKDRDVFADARIHFISEDGDLPSSILDRVRAVAAEPDRRRKVRKTVSG